MIEGAGVVRSADSLAAAGTSLEALAAEHGGGTPADRAHGELANLVTAAASLLALGHGARARPAGPTPAATIPEASDRVATAHRPRRRRGGRPGRAGPAPGRGVRRPVTAGDRPPGIRRRVATTVDPPRAAVVEAVTPGHRRGRAAPRATSPPALVPATATATVAIVSRAPGVVAGRACALETFAQIDPTLEVAWRIGDGGDVAPGTVVAEVIGSLRSILTAERTALNFLGHLSGVASLTRRYVDAVQAANPATRVLDTRKTTPGLRALEKAAVRAGGGHNHRGSLSDAVLVKDNHLAGLSIAEAVARASGAVAGTDGGGRVRPARPRWTRRWRPGPP